MLKPIRKSDGTRHARPKFKFGSKKKAFAGGPTGPGRFTGRASFASFVMRRSAADIDLQLLKAKLLAIIDHVPIEQAYQKFGRGNIERWRESRAIIVLAFNDRLLVPEFQFYLGTPKQEIAEVIRVFESKLTDWQIAFWLYSANPWLDGDIPLNHLSDGLAATAAEMLLQPIG